MKTLTQLKKDAKSNNLYLTLIERFGSENFPENFKGERHVTNISSTRLELTNKKGAKSYLEFPPASLIEYTDETLTIFNPGLREPNEFEKNLLKDWKKQIDEKLIERDIATDGNTCFWRRKSFFQSHNAEYLMGHKFEKGLKYDFNSEKILDKKIKGSVLLKYKVTIKTIIHEIPLESGKSILFREADGNYIIETYDNLNNYIEHLSRNIVKYTEEPTLEEFSTFFHDSIETGGF